MHQSVAIRLICVSSFLASLLFVFSPAQAEVWEMRLLEFDGVQSIPHSGDWSNTGEWIDPNTSDGKALPGSGDTVRIRPDNVSNRPNITLDIPVEIYDLDIFSDLSDQLFVGVLDMQADFYTPDGGQDLTLGGELKIRADTITTWQDQGETRVEYGNTDVFFDEVYASATDVIITKSLENFHGRATLELEGGGILSRNSFKLERATMVLRETPTIVALGSGGLNIDANSQISFLSGAYLTANTTGGAGIVNNGHLGLVDADVQPMFSFFNGKVTGSGTIAIGENHTLVLDQDESATTSNITGRISGGGTLHVAGDLNTVQLRGSNTFSGGIIIRNGGTLDAAAGSNLGSIQNDITIFDGTLRSSGNFTVGIPVNILGDAKFDTNGRSVAASAPWTGISNTSLTKTGAGDLTLNNNGNGFNGDFIVEQGTLVSGSGDTFSNNSAVDINAGATLLFRGAENFAGLKGEGLVNFSGQTVRVGYNHGSYDFAGAMVGAGTFEKHGNGIQQFSGDNTNYSGSWNIFDGNLTFTTQTSLPSSVNIQSGAGLIFNPASEPFTFDGTITGPGVVRKQGSQTAIVDTSLSSFGGSFVIEEGTLQFDAAPPSTTNVNIGPSGTLSTGNASLYLESPVTIYDTYGTIDSGPGQIILGGELSGYGDLVKRGAGNLYIFHSSNGFTGDVDLRDGSFKYDRSNMLANSKLNIEAGASAGAFQVGAGDSFFDYQVQELTGKGTLEILANQSFTVGAGNDGTYIYGGKLSGAGQFIKTGTGTLSLNGDNESFAGSMIASQGTLKLSHFNALPSNSGLEIHSAATAEVVGEQRIRTVTGTGQLRLSTAKLFIGLDDATSHFQGDLTGNRNLIKTGEGVFTISGGLSGYSGAFEIWNGVLELENQQFGFAPAITVQGGELRVASDTTLSKTFSSVGGTVNTNSFDIDLTGPLYGNHPLTKKGEGTLRLSNTGNNLQSTLVVEEGSVVFAGNRFNPNTNTSIDIKSGATVKLEAERRLRALSGSGTLDFGSNNVGIGNDTSTTFSGKLMGTGTINYQGTGQLTLSGNNSSYTGNIEVNAGTLRLDNSFGSNQFYIGRNATLISGSGDTFTNSSMVNVGDGTLRLEGDENFGSLLGAGMVDLNGHAMRIGYNNSPSDVYFGTIVGDGQIVKNGSGRTTFNGESTGFTGNWLLNSGTLRFARGSSLHTDATVLNDATLQFDFTTGSYSYDGSLSGNGNIQKTGGGRLTLTGDSSSFTGEVDVLENQLIVNGTLGASSVNLHDGTTLAGIGAVHAPVILSTGSTLSPGLSPGHMTLQSLDLKVGSNFVVEVDGLQAGQFDTITVLQDATLGGTLDLDFDPTFIPPKASQWLIMEVAGTVTGQFTGLSEGAHIGHYGGTDLFISYLGGDGNDILLFNTIPEPTTAFMLVLGLITTLARRSKTTS